VKYFIYTLKDPKTNLIRYVGKTKNLEDRYSRHLQPCYLEKYDKNTYKSNWIKKILKDDEKPIMEILDVGDINNINDLEIYWIEQLRQWGFKLVNLSDGGEIGVNWKGRKHTEKSKELNMINQPNRKEVIQYDLNGNILGEYKSISEASKKTKCHIAMISNCCNKKSHYTVKGTVFRYVGDEFDYTSYNKKVQKSTKKVNQYDLIGNFIKTHDSIKECAIFFNIGHSNISRCCKKKYKTDTHGRKTNKPIIVKGYTFRYFNDTF
jgi:hypothetical protein